jgi:hypothetical protein
MENKKNDGFLSNGQKWNVGNSSAEQWPTKKPTMTVKINSAREMEVYRAIFLD